MFANKNSDHSHNSIVSGRHKLTHIAAKTGILRHTILWNTTTLTKPYKIPETESMSILTFHMLQLKTIKKKEEVSYLINQNGGRYSIKLFYQTSGIIILQFSIEHCSNELSRPLCKVNKSVSTLFYLPIRFIATKIICECLLSPGAIYRICNWCEGRDWLEQAWKKKTQKGRN